jgi:glycosyltransferase involved in cell wall biosynthesis
VGGKRKYSQKNGIFQRLIFMIACVFRGAKCDFDLVEGTSFITYLPAFILGKLKHTKITFWYPDCWVGEWVKNIGWTGFFCELLERLTLIFGKNVFYIAISESTKNKLIEQGIKANRIKIISCGVDEDEIKNVGVSHGKPLQIKYDLITVNRLVKYKNTKLTFCLAIENNYSFLVIGEGEERSKLESFIQQSKTQGRIKIIPKVKNHLELLRQVSVAKIFISASLVEGFDIAAVEAAAMGLPCLLSDIPAHRELAKKLPGILIFHDRKKLGTMINNLLHDEKYYHELSVANSKNANKYYWHDIIKTTERTYEHNEK